VGALCTIGYCLRVGALVGLKAAEAQVSRAGAFEARGIAGPACLRALLGLWGVRALTDSGTGLARGRCVLLLRLALALVTGALRAKGVLVGPRGARWVRGAFAPVCSVRGVLPLGQARGGVRCSGLKGDRGSLALGRALRLSRRASLRGYSLRGRVGLGRAVITGLFWAGLC